MKTIVNNLFALLITVSAFANGTPTKTTTLLETSKMEITLVNADDVNVFESTIYSDVNESLSFNLNDEITFVQIFDQDETMMYQLPVMSDKLTIGSSLLAEGKYKFGFMLSKTEKIHFAQILIKE